MAKDRNSIDRDLYRKTTLKNGLRVVTERMPSVRSISLGVWIDVGSRDENATENGVTHFIEHMLFKGTKTRTARQIASALESVGGSLNAFTSKEQTCFTARILDENLNIAVEVLADILCHATLTPTNLAREKLVVCEEIKESLDSPADQIHDIFAETYWGSNSLGQPILGTSKIIMKMSRARVVDYLKRHYRSSSIVIAASGSISHDRLVRLVRKHFAFASGEGQHMRSSEIPTRSRLRIESNGNAQTHLCIGFPGLPYSSPERTAALVLNTYLGGGMSSVLFQKIREQRGLAYSVYSYNDLFRDTGMFGVYVGTDQRHLKSAIEIILKETERLKRRSLTTTQVDLVKNQLKGHLVIGLESTSGRMGRLARQELMLNRFVPLKETIKAIDDVSPGDIQKLARSMFDEDRMAIATLGPANEKDLKSFIH